MNIRTVTKAASAFMVFAFCLISSYQAWGESSAHINLKTTTPQKLTLTVGKSIIIGSPAPVRRVSLAAPEIADVLVLTPRQIYLTGKAPGITNLTLWSDTGKVSAIFDLDVSPDIAGLKEKLHEMLPQEEDIRVTATRDNIALSGAVSSTANLSQALALAQSYAPGDKKGTNNIINLLEVAGVHQVMLEVRFSEMSRSIGKKLGVNFNFITSDGSKFGLSLLDNLTSPPAGGSTAASSVNAIFRFLNNGTKWTGFIDALKDQGLLKVLAEPTLITLSGKTASFLAGGEFPVPIPQEGGTITIEYKSFGVGLNFTPTVLSNGKINLQVAPEVSDLDFSNAVALGGFVVPGLTTRRVSTAIELADGQSFAIAGLLNNNVREVVRKFPVLGDIPVLGALFRSSSFQKNETELIVIVTPHLVKPLDMAKQTLPTDQYIEPDDFEFFLLGRLEGRAKIDSSGAAAPLPAQPNKELGLEGDFGHIVP